MTLTDFVKFLNYSMKSSCEKCVNWHEHSLPHPKVLVLVRSSLLRTQLSRVTMISISITDLRTGNFFVVQIDEKKKNNKERKEERKKIKCSKWKELMYLDLRCMKGSEQ